MVGRRIERESVAKSEKKRGSVAESDTVWELKKRETLWEWELERRKWEPEEKRKTFWELGLERREWDWELK